MAATQLDGKIDFCRKKGIKDYVVRVAQQLPAAERNQLSLELLPSIEFSCSHHVTYCNMLRGYY